MRLVGSGQLSPEVVKECRGEVGALRVHILVLDDGRDVVEDKGAAETRGKRGRGKDEHD